MNNSALKPTKRYSDLKAMLNDAAKMFGERDAYRWKSGKNIVSKTYTEFKNDTMAFSNALEKLSLTGKHVAVIGPTSYEWVVTYFGTVNSNSVIVPIDKELPADEIADLLNRADVAALVYAKSLSDRIEKITQQCNNIEYYISMEQAESDEHTLSFSQLISENQGEYEVEIDNEKMCAILFTSGTTGKSKGVMLSHTSLADNATCVDTNEKEGCVTLSVLPAHHAYCFTCDILAGICIGSTCCFNDSIMRLTRNMGIFNPSIILLVPMIIESFYYKLREMTKDVPAAMLNRSMLNPVLGTNLHTIYSGGAYLNPELIDFFAQFDIALVQGYGMTEFSPRISQNVRGNQKKGSVGMLIPDCEAKIEDGELWVKGKSRMLGYYKDEQSTNEALSGEWLRTGDLAKIDEDNFVFLTGRKKNLIILSNGENVSPEELENKFNGWLVAKELMIYSAEGRITCEIFPNADFVAMAGITDVEAAFAQKVEEVNTDLPLYKRITKTIVRENEFEKTASGKIKRKHNQ